MWQDVQFAGGLHTALSPSAAPQGTLAECNNADVTKGDVRSRPGLLLLGTPAGLAESPVIKGIGWGQYNGIQELLYAVTDASGGITVFKWAPGDTNPIALSPSLNIGATVVISHGALGKHIYVAVSRDNVTDWYRHEVGRIPPHAEAFRKVKGASSVSPPASIAYEWTDVMYKPFGTTGDGSFILYTSTGTPPTSVALGDSGTYVKALYPTSTEPGSELEVTVNLGESRRFLIDFIDAKYMRFNYRNCLVEVRYMEFETEGGAYWRGTVWGQGGEGGTTHASAHSWVIFPIQDERRSLRDTEKVTKVSFKIRLVTTNPTATPEVWIDSPFISGTYLWLDPWLPVQHQPLKYAAHYIDNAGNESAMGAVTTVGTPQPPDARASIGGHLKLTPAASTDPKMSSGSIVIWRALRFNGDREERWFKMATIPNNASSPNSTMDKYLPREHSRNEEGGIGDASTTLPVEGTVRAIKPHQERLFIGVDNLIWVSAMGNPEMHVVDVGFDPLAPTAPERHFASADRSANVTGFASGDALLVCTDKGAFMEFGWPDQISYQRVKVFEDPCTASVPAAEAMGSAVFSSTMGAYGATPNGAVEELSGGIRGNLSAYNTAWYRGEVYLVNGTNLKYLTRTGGWQEATLGKSIYAMYGGFSNLPYVLAVGNDGKLYGFDPAQATDDGAAITWRVVTNMVKVPDHTPVEVRVASTGTPPTVKLIVPGRSEVPVAMYNQAGFTTQDFNGLGLQVVVEGSQDTVVSVVQIRWEPDGDRPMQ